MTPFSAGPSPAQAWQVCFTRKRFGNLFPFTDNLNMESIGTLAKKQFETKHCKEWKLENNI